MCERVSLQVSTYWDSEMSWNTLWIYPYKVLDSLRLFIVDNFEEAIRENVTVIDDDDDDDQFVSE